MSVYKTVEKPVWEVSGVEQVRGQTKEPKSRNGGSGDVVLKGKS